MKRTHIFSPFQSAAFFLCSASLLCAGELWVNQAAQTSGNGSADAPFKTISEAINASAESDTVTIHAGTYHESVTLKSGTAAAPYTLRSAADERVVLSSLKAVDGWQAIDGGCYTTVVDWPVRDLYVGYQPQPISIWPNKDKTWRAISAVNAESKSIVDLTPSEASPLTPLVGETADAFVFAYFRAGNYHANFHLKSIDPATGTLALQDSNRFKALKPNDSYIVCNHPSLIDRPGEWAYETIQGNQTRITFLPHSVEDLQRTQARGSSRAIISTAQAGNRHVIIDGIETAGGRGTGIQITDSEFIEVRNCIAHSSQHAGISVNQSEQIKLTHNIVFGNDTGINVYTSKHVTIEANEIAANQMDGLIISGSRSGKRNPDDLWPTSDIAIRNNYIHHHLDLGHPDNIQTYFGVRNLQIEDNLLLFSGQGIMMSDTEQGTLSGNIIYGAAAMLAIFGHNSTNDWTLERNTFGLGYWGSCNLSGNDYRFFENVFYANDLGVPETYSGDRNLLSTGTYNSSRLITKKPRWIKHESIASFTTATGHDGHSQYADPQFINAPSQQIAVDAGNLANTADTVNMRKKGATKGFKVGDTIEINGDGIARKVTAVGSLKLEFTPPLPRPPFRNTLIWNWNQGSDFQLDLNYAPTSPALTMGEAETPIGSAINIPAYQRGDFNGDGVRDLPTLNAELQEAWPTINDPIIPASGI